MASTYGNVVANIPFIKKNDLYKTEKAYGADIYTEKIPRSNIKTDLVEGIAIADIRPNHQSFSYEKDGFGVLKFDTSMSLESFFDQSLVEDVYCQEVGEFVQNFLHASTVQVFEAQVRRRHSSFPHGFVDRSIGFQPAMRPHIDSSRSHTIEKIQLLNGDIAERLLTKRWMYINTWKPLKGPVREWPLAICHPDSIDEHTDLLEVDNVRNGQHAENITLHYNPNQRWMYLSDQMPDELFIFRQADSEGRTGVPHASFDLKYDRGEKVVPRESVEVRMIAYFD